MGRSRPEPVMPVTAPLRDQPGYECGHGTLSEPKIGSTP
jgi:hypothetical protein